MATTPGPTSTTASTAAPSPSPPRSFRLQTTTKTIATLPPDSYLVHATNCLGSWGAGIAADLARLFPAARALYTQHCHAAAAAASARWPPRAALIGSCLVIPPQAADVAAGAPRVSIVCLFTSHGYGRASRTTGKPGRDAPGAIVGATRAALREFRGRLEGEEGKGRGLGCEVYSPCFNSGLFKVPWERTERVIAEELAGWEGRWLVLRLPK